MPPDMLPLAMGSKHMQVTCVKTCQEALAGSIVVGPSLVRVDPPL